MGIEVTRISRIEIIKFYSHRLCFEEKFGEDKGRSRNEGRGNN